MRENGAHKPSDSCSSETLNQPSPDNSLKNELKHVDSSSHVNAKRIDTSEALLNQERKSISHTGDHKVISPSETSEEGSSKAELNLVQAQAYKSTASADTGKDIKTCKLFSTLYLKDHFLYLDFIKPYSSALDLNPKRVL